METSSGRVHYEHAALETVKCIYKNQITILAGTDANLQPHLPATVRFGLGSSMHDLENLVEAGMSNLEALRAACHCRADFGAWAT